MQFTRRQKTREAIAVVGMLYGLSTSTALAAMPPVPVPPQNPLTAAKAVLGKMLFWDEQLSTDDTVACGTCHIPANGGGDPRLGHHPGADGNFDTPDDIFGSPGIALLDSNGLPKRHSDFDFDPQVTGRAAQSYFGMMYADDLFWDGRADEVFRDPITDAIVIPAGGGLESQAVGPILSSVEMAKEGRTWAEVVEKLDRVTPMRLASNLPADVAAALVGDPSYGDLFQTAFGDPAITPARIAFAIASYERTLVPDETPWDLFDEGNPTALTPNQITGLNVFMNLDCDNCHTPPTFTNDNFHNIGLRPSEEDLGRFAINGQNNDRGDFKTPSLRNTGLRVSLMHTGHIEDVADAVDFYREGPGHQHFEEDQDNIPNGGGNYNFNVNGGLRNALINFIENGLTDPRVAAETAPFDRPTLRSETGNPALACDPTPRVDCKEPTVPGQAPLVIRDVANDAQDTVIWRWRRGEETSGTDYGNPVNVDGVIFCVYTGVGQDLSFQSEAPAGEECNGSACWKKLRPNNSGDRGFLYKDRNREFDGVQKVLLRTGEEGKARLLFKAKGDTLESTPAGLPTAPIDLPVVAQLQSAGGECFSESYTNPTRNEDGKFIAR